MALLGVDGRVEALGRWTRYAKSTVAGQRGAAAGDGAPGRRGRRLARRLVAALVDDARASGCRCSPSTVRGKQPRRDGPVRVARLRGLRPAPGLRRRPSTSAGTGCSDRLDLRRADWPLRRHGPGRSAQARPSYVAETPGAINGRRGDPDRAESRIALLGSCRSSPATVHARGRRRSPARRRTRGCPARPRPHRGATSPPRPASARTSSCGPSRPTTSTPAAATAYARGHLRSIARFVGIDPRPLVDEYDRRYATRRCGPRTAPLELVEPHRDAGRSGGSRRRGPRSRPACWSSSCCSSARAWIVGQPRRRRAARGRDQPGRHDVAGAAAEPDDGQRRGRRSTGAWCCGCRPAAGRAGSSVRSSTGTDDLPGVLTDGMAKEFRDDTKLSVRSATRSRSGVTQNGRRPRLAAVPAARLHRSRSACPAPADRLRRPVPLVSARPACPVPVVLRLVTLGCARNEVDSEELAGRLTPTAGAHRGRRRRRHGGGQHLRLRGERQEGLDRHAAGRRRPGAGRSSRSAASPSGTARSWPSRCPRPTRCSASTTTPTSRARLDDVLAGEPAGPHRPRDRRTLLPITPVSGRGTRSSVPGHAVRGRRVPGLRTPPVLRRRLGDGAGRPAEAGLRLRPALHVLRDPVVPRRVRLPAGRRAARRGRPGWPRQGVRELVLVSENSTSYGKDLGDLRLLETLLPRAGRGAGHRPGPGVLPAAGRDPARAGRGDRRARPASRRTSTCPSSTPARPVLRRMRRFGDTERFLACSTRCGRWRPQAGVRSNVIVGFPGETGADVAELSRFLAAARLDAIGVFGYSRRGRHRGGRLTGKVRRGRDRRRAAEQ